MQKEVIKKLKELYIVQTGKYLRQSKRGYITCIAVRSNYKAKTSLVNRMASYRDVSREIVLASPSPYLF
ncbi:hypothetical protein JOC55_002709 [Paenibacillus sacheonensis]|nr:hypothetical protein [Paenibacillus sacheonensis]